MPFIDITTIPAFNLLPGCRLRTPHGEKIMLSYVQMDAGAIIPTHSHPHEQAGMLLKGRMELTIGNETRLCEPGAMYIIPANTAHKAVAIGGPIEILDIFSPIREDYAAMNNAYIPPPK